MNQSVYENVLQNFKESQKTSHIARRENFFKSWSKNLELLVDSRFPNMQVIKDILNLAARYAVTEVLNEDLEVEHYSHLFKARDIITEFIEQFKDDELLVASDFKEKICQAVECLQGPNSDISLLRPAPNTPDQVFYEAYLLTLMHYGKNK